MEQEFNKKLEEVMHSIDGIEKASPASYFFTRLEARMQKQRSAWEMISSYVAKPVVAFACICLIIIINIAVIFSATNSINAADQQNNELVAADEYNSVSAPLYEFVNAKP